MIFDIFKGDAPFVNGTVDAERVTSMDELDDNNDKDAKKNINDNKVPTIKVSYFVLKNTPTTLLQPPH